MSKTSSAVTASIPGLKKGVVRFEMTGVRIPKCSAMFTSVSCFRGSDILERDLDIDHDLVGIIPVVGFGLWTRCRVVNDHDYVELLRLAAVTLGFEGSFVDWADRLIELGMQISPLQIESGFNETCRVGPRKGELLVDRNGVNNYFFVQHSDPRSDHPKVSMISAYWSSRGNRSGMKIESYPLDEIASIRCSKGDIVHLGHPLARTFFDK